MFVQRVLQYNKYEGERNTTRLYTTRGLSQCVNNSRIPQLMDPEQSFMIRRQDLIPPSWDFHVSLGTMPSAYNDEANTLSEVVAY